MPLLIYTLTDDQFLQLVRMHNAHVNAAVAHMQELNLMSNMLEAEAKRRSARAAALPGQVNAQVQAILDKNK